MQFWSLLLKLFLFVASFAGLYVLLFLCIELTFQSFLFAEIANGTPTAGAFTTSVIVPIVVAAIAAIATFLGTWFVFVLSSKAQRQKATIDYIISVRGTEQFARLQNERQELFPAGRDIEKDLFQWAHLGKPTTTRSKPPNKSEKASKRALVEILNIYEFLATGILQDVFDEKTAKGLVRGIMCSLVHDARFVVSDLRRQNPKTYQNLAWLYAEWHEKGSPHELPIPE